MPPPNPPSAAPRIRLKGGVLVTMDAQGTHGPGDLLIQGDRIVAVGATKKSKVDEIIDCTGCLVIPGLIQPHTHLCQTLFRGLADDLPLLDWLRDRIWPMEAAHDRASLLTSSLLGGAELLRTGTTAILDMATVRHTDAVFEACRQLGLRATIGKAMMDKGQGLPAGLRDTTENALDESLALAARWHGADEGRLRYAFAPRFALSCSEALLEATSKAARARGLRLHTHASENADELVAVQEQTGRSNVVYLNDVGLTGEDTVLAHGVWLTAGEQRLLAETKTSIAHCPSSNLKLGSGFARVPDLLQQGINVGLAADGAPCNNNLDAFVEMRLAGLIHKPKFGADAMPAKTVVQMATMNGARALGLQDEIGSLEPGKKADVVVVHADRLHASPAGNPYAALVYALHGQDVRHVFVDGILRVKNGRVLGLDVAGLLADAADHVRRIHTEVLGGSGEWCEGALRPARIAPTRKRGRRT